MIKFSLNQIKFLSTTSVLLLSCQSIAIANPNINKKLKLKELPSKMAQMFDNNQEQNQNQNQNQEQEQQPDVLVPNPTIKIDGKPVDSSQPSPPPMIPRAVAPPVGDMSVSHIDAKMSQMIDLGPNGLTIVPRLVLRDAPANEVLALLARAADLNIVFVDQGAEGQEDTNGFNTISLDLVDQPVQEVFNNVLVLSGLQANQRGNTIFVGKKLPTMARNFITRTIRLNQATPGAAANFLASQGAEVSIVFTPIEREFNTETGAVIRETEQPTELRTIEVPRSGEGTRSALPLTGLQVTTDDRTGSINLVGESYLIETATSFLTQLDLRRRQVAVNVKVVDIDLDQTDSFGSSFSAGIDDTGIVQDGGVGVINFGTNNNNVQNPRFFPNPGQITPFGTLADPDNLNNRAPTTPGLNFNLPQAFLAQIRASVQSGNAKILTDPTLVVQEGQVGAVELVENVVTSVESQIDTEGDTGVRTTTPIIEPAGLTLNVEIDKIDDNGFVSLRVNPSISAPGDEQIFRSGDGADNVIRPLVERTVSSGLIRLRDGQTLILSGIITDTERSIVSKIPVLGDIPLLGSLFRATRKERARSEVVVVLTPQVLDDSDSYSGFGYNYTPSRETGEYLRDKGISLPTAPY